MTGCRHDNGLKRGFLPHASVWRKFNMTGFWMGVIVGSFALAIAAILVIGHYRREHLRYRLLRQMEHHLHAGSPRGRQ